MSMTKTNQVAYLLCLLVTMTGCATMPEAPESTVADELRHKNMDVLFATEFPVASMEEALNIAAQSQAAGDIDKAIFFYVRALQFDETNVQLLTHIGDIHHRRGDTEMARRAFLRAKKHDPEYAPVLESLGLIYMAEGRDEDAIAELSRSIVVDAARWRAHNALGVYADKNGDYATAQSHYQAALAINPAATHVLANAGYSRFLAGDVANAIAELHSAAHDRGFDAAWGNLALVYASEGRYEESVMAFTRVMNEANAYSAAGRIAMKNGDLRVAHVLLTEAIDRSSTYFPKAEENLRRLEASGVTATPLQLSVLHRGVAHE